MFRWLTLFAGISAWYATREAVRRRDTRRRLERTEVTRWEGEGGAAPDASPPPAAF
jgi:hypothetical protein